MKESGEEEGPRAWGKRSGTRRDFHGLSEVQSPVDTRALTDKARSSPAACWGDPRGEQSGPHRGPHTGALASLGHLGLEVR